MQFITLNVQYIVEYVYPPAQSSSIMAAEPVMNAQASEMMDEI